jgi:hypothetical protein
LEEFNNRQAAAAVIAAVANRFHDWLALRGRFINAKSHVWPANTWRVEKIPANQVALALKL